MSMVAKYKKLRSRNIFQRKTLSITPDMAAKLKTEEKSIVQFLSEKNPTPWLRGTSDFQMNAANKLYYALRDDTDQQTTYRVEACLKQIGIEPMVGPAEISLVLELAKKNDLAFLWFLWEAYYKTPGKRYSVNEQLIFSTIAHLDMITTFRELDRILPPGQPPKHEIARRKRLEQEEKIKRAQKIQKPFSTAPPYPTRDNEVQSNMRKKSYKLPYFQAQPEPQYIGNKTYASRPGFKVEFKSYERYRDPYYHVPNESNRWYTNYAVNPNKRIALNILTEEINNIFEQLTNTFAENLIQSLINTELHSIIIKISDKKKVTETPTRSLCAHHRVQEEMEKRLKLDAIGEEKERCHAYVNPSKYLKEKKQQDIVDQLEKEVDSSMAKNRNFAKFTKNRGRTHMMVLKGNSECDVQSVASNICEEEKDSEEKPKCVLHRNSKENYADDRKSQSSRRNSKHSQYFACRGLYHGEVRTLTNCSGHRRSDHFISSWDLGCRPDLDDKTTAPSERFFEAPTENKPYQFNYPTIFSFENKDELNIKDTFRKAIISDDVKVDMKSNDRKSNIDVAVKCCVKKVWQDNVARKKEELKAKEEENQKEAKAKMSKRKTPLNYDQDYYDPDDKVLMNNLLKDALDYMKKNPKFVLASLPDAHKTPVLQEFVRRHFGKVYSTVERNESFAASRNIFHAVNKLLVTLPQANSKEYGTRTFGTYACCKYYKRKAKQYSEDFYKRFDECIMELSRILWLTMRPYLCANGPPRKTFFAYMPSRPGEIKHFRPWKKWEFRQGTGPGCKKVSNS